MRRQPRLLVEQLESRRLLAAVNIPTNLTGNAGSVVAAPVQIDTASGVRAAEIRLSYDTDILNITTDAIQAGSLWSGNSDTQVTANVDDAAGTIVLFVTSATPLTGTSGSLALLNFTLAAGAATADTATLNLTSVRLNEGTIAVSPAPAAGADSTDGLITVSSTASGNGSISGFVFADANRNGTLDAGEAISGVTITLTNSSTGASQSVTSGTDGGYSFASLAAAGYRLQQTQPAAYFEGGVNSLTVTLTAGSSLTNQNFVEGGLQPSAIFTRLRTTLVMPIGSTAWQSAIAAGVQSVSTTSSSQSTSLSTASVAPAAFSNNISTQSSNTSNTGLVAEGEYSPPPVISSGAAPLLDVETRDKQRLAAIEQAIMDL